jgi:hypothetical protein
MSSALTDLTSPRSQFLTGGSLPDRTVVPTPPTGVFLGDTDRDCPVLALPTFVAHPKSKYITTCRTKTELPVFSNK